MSYQHLLHQFGFITTEEPVSIYPFSPVFKVSKDGVSHIIKRTTTNYYALFMYLHHLSNSKIDVVQPLAPITIYEGIPFVCYPFIEGETYIGTDEQLIAAGSLLGAIHAASTNDNRFKLKQYNVYDFTIEEVEDHWTRIQQHATTVGYTISNHVKQVLLSAVLNQHILEQSNLPYVSTPHDYKANNLIYTPTPFLIDPDNAVYIPRIFDVALSLLLFTNDLSIEHTETLSPQQWQSFLSGYTQHIEITSFEKEYWPLALKHVFLDEVMWMLADCAEDWENPYQFTRFQGLFELILNIKNYPLEVLSHEY